MAPRELAEIQSFIQKELASTPFACSSLSCLSGGTANFTFRASLEHPQPLGSKPGEVVQEVLVKHGEPYVAQNPSLALSTSRCEVEDCILRAATISLAPAVTPSFSVRTPKSFLFHKETSTQVQEYLPNAINLKSYCLKYFAPSSSSPDHRRFKARCEELGRALGLWLRSLHEWTAAAPSPEQRLMRDEVARGSRESGSQGLKHFINFGWLVEAVDKFPAILGDARDTFVEVGEAARRELEDDRMLQVIHGDFWTGNVLLPNEPLEEGHSHASGSHPTEVFVIDWELSHLGIRPLDMGQMVAELYQLTLFKGIDAGMWIIQGLVEGYGPVDEAVAFRTAIQAGTHIISFGASVEGWGTKEDVERVVGVAKEIIIKACWKDRAWFDRHPLGCLFPRPG